MTAFTIASKSPWHPAMRREHHFALMAAKNGHEVTFIEQPRDLRSAVPKVVPYLRGFPGRESEASSIRVMQRSVLVPGHRGRVWQNLDTWHLERILRPLDGPVVHYLPWQFAASNAKVRRVFDCTDNWLTLYPESAGPLLRESFSRIAHDADEIIVVSPDLAELFPGRTPIVIPNGVDAFELADEVAPKPAGRRLVFVGTLSERVDLDALSAISEELPDWTIDLYGPCRFSGSGDQPSLQLRALVDRSGGRVVLKGMVAKREVSRVLDHADVLVVPTVRGFAKGQSSMKLLDAAARGRPAVVSPEVTIDGMTQPPGTYIASEPRDWAPQILAAASEPASLGEQRRDFARRNTWEERWTSWMAAVGIDAQDGEG